MQDIKKKFWLEKFDCFSVTGKDARKFLNGITTGNILNSENKVIKTCWLTPNGVCLLYTSDAADEEDSVDLGGRRIIKWRRPKLNK